MHPLPSTDSPPPLRAGALVTAIVATIRTNIRELWPVWLGVAAAGAVAQYLGVRLGLERPDGSVTLGYIGLLAGLTALSSMYAAIAIRIMLGRGRAAWRGDRHLLAYVAFTTAAGLAPVLLMLGLMGGAPAPGAASTDPAAAGRMLIGSVVGLATMYVLFRLTVFQTSLAMGPPVPVRVAWGLTRRALWAVVAAFAILGLAPMMVGVAGAGLYREQGDLFALAAGSLGTGFSGLVSNAIAAEIYRARAPTAEAAASAFD